MKNKYLSVYFKLVTLTSLFIAPFFSMGWKESHHGFTFWLSIILLTVSHMLIINRLSMTGLKLHIMNKGEGELFGSLGKSQLLLTITTLIYIGWVFYIFFESMSIVSTSILLLVILFLGTYGKTIIISNYCLIVGNKVTLLGPLYDFEVFEDHMAVRFTENEEEKATVIHWPVKLGKAVKASYATTKEVKLSDSERGRNNHDFSAQNLFVRLLNGAMALFIWLAYALIISFDGVGYYVISDDPDGALLFAFIAWLVLSILVISKLLMGHLNAIMVTRNEALSTITHLIGYKVKGFLVVFTLLLSALMGYRWAEIDYLMFLSFILTVILMINLGIGSFRLYLKLQEQVE